MSFDELVAKVTARLREHGIDHRVIGATALAAHGVTRSTADVDLLVADAEVLRGPLWEGAVPPGFEVDIRRGDADDPLVGVVRFEGEMGDDPDWENPPEQLDLVLPRGRWADRMSRSNGPELEIGAIRLRAVTAGDLVLLKLYAGGINDQRDIQQLIATQSDRSALVTEVDSRVSELPKRCAQLWRTLRPNHDPA